MTTTELALALLEGSDVPSLNAFDCGDEDLNDFWVSDAWRLQVENVAKTYLAFDTRNEAVVGYFTLLSDSLHLLTRERRKLGLASDDHPIVPATKIARLGVDKNAQGLGAGRFLVRAAFAVSRDVAELTGCHLLTVDAYPAALPFYEKLGFSPNRSPNYRGKEHPSLRFDLFGPAAPDWS